MVKIINICSGKGGVGKTTVAANVGAVLSLAGARTAVVDCNLTTSHLGLLFGFYNAPKTLNHFLRNEANIEEIVYAHKSGLRIVPASLELNDLANVNTEDLKTKLKEAFKHYDFVLLDSAPGIGKEALIAMKASDEAVYVANPYVPSVVDIMKLKHLSESIGFENKGIVINRHRKKDYEVHPRDISHLTGLDILGVVPEDEAILKATNSRSLSIFSHPKSESSRAFADIARAFAQG